MQDKLSRMKDVVSDPQTLLFEMKKKKRDLIFWFAGITFTVITFLFLSSKDYSFLLVLSALIQMLSFLIIVLKVYNSQNCSGLSVNTLICYAILLTSRLCSTLFYNGYLPSDQAGDWFYQLTEIISLLSVLLLIYMITKIYKDTADSYNDIVDFYYLALPSLALALIVHTSLNRNFLTDVLWTFSMYLEGVAVFPQIQLFSRKKGQIESYTSHYVALMGLSRLFCLLFWWDTYPELNEPNTESYSLFHEYCGYFIIASQVTQLGILLDYYYLYFKSLVKGENMTISDL